MCLARDELVRKAREGDERAWAILLKIMPADVPRRVLQAMRDRRLQEIASGLRTSCSERQIAEILAVAGLRLASANGHLPAHGVIIRLAPSERAQLVDDIRAILRWWGKHKWPGTDG